MSNQTDEMRHFSEWAQEFDVFVDTEEADLQDSMREIAAGQIDAAAGMFRRLVNYPKYAKAGDDVKPRGGQRTLEDGSKVLPLIIRDGSAEKFVVGYTVGEAVCRYILSEEAHTLTMETFEANGDFRAQPFPEDNLPPLEQAEVAAKLQGILRAAFRHDVSAFPSEAEL